VTIRVDAGGREYSQDELDSIYAQRSYFTLHEMRRLGATLHGLRSRDLSEAEIDALPAANVRQVLLDNKLRLGAEELNRIYADQYREADAMWYRIAAASDGDFSRKVARTHLMITGVNPLRAMRLMARSVRLGRLLLEMEPDHIDVGATHVTEIMGMYGRPTRMKASLGVEAPIPLSPDHPWRLIGASHLAGDRNLVNAHRGAPGEARQGRPGHPGGGLLPRRHPGRTGRWPLDPYGDRVLEPVPDRSGSPGPAAFGLRIGRDAPASPAAPRTCGGVELRYRVGTEEEATTSGSGYHDRT